MVKVFVVVDFMWLKVNGYRFYNVVIDFLKKYIYICLEFVSIKFWSLF